MGLPQESRTPMVTPSKIKKRSLCLNASCLTRFSAGPCLRSARSGIRTPSFVGELVDCNDELQSRSWRSI